jgi:protein gp37
MAGTTKIEWCDSTMNPWMGCTKVGPGCDNCYAEATLDHRLHLVNWGAGQPRKHTAHAYWQQPLKWNESPFFQCAACGWRGTDRDRLKSFALHGRCCRQMSLRPARRRVFCASLADVFDNQVPVDWRRELFDLIELTPNLDWLLLTKRIGNVVDMVREARSWDWMLGRRNVWLGATIVNQEEADRDIPKLLETPARVRFLSMEPLLGPVDLTNLTFGGFRTKAIAGWSNDEHGLHWVIVGGESGHAARPMHPYWARSLRDQCAAAGVPFLFKQHGEWLPTTFCDDDMAMLPSRRTVYVARDGTFHDGSAGVDFFGGDEETAWVGKKAAGRVLDGRTHDEFPQEANRCPA